MGKFDRNPSHAIHFELVCKDGRPGIDLSVLGTPSALPDDDVIVRRGETGGLGKSRECLVFSKADMLTRFGTSREELELQAKRADGTYHAYVFSRITRVGVTLSAVFADDGHKVPALENQSINQMLQDASLSSDWSIHGGVRMNVIRLGQVARPDLLVGSPKPDAILGSADKPIDSVKQSASKATQDGIRGERRQVDDGLIL